MRYIKYIYFIILSIFINNKSIAQIEIIPGYGFTDFKIIGITKKELIDKIGKPKSSSNYKEIRKGSISAYHFPNISVEFIIGFDTLLGFDLEENPYKISSVYLKNGIVKNVEIFGYSLNEPNRKNLFIKDSIYFRDKIKTIRKLKGPLLHYKEIDAEEHFLYPEIGIDLIPFDETLGKVYIFAPLKTTIINKYKNKLISGGYIDETYKSSKKSVDAIGELKNDAQIIRFIRKVTNNDNGFQNFRFLYDFEYKDQLAYKSLKMKPYYVCDFDNNGYSDILYNAYGEISLYNSSIIMSFPNEEYKVYDVDKNLIGHICYYSILKKRNQIKIVQYRDLINNPLFSSDELAIKSFKSNVIEYTKRGNSLKAHKKFNSYYLIDTLIFKFGSFINYSETISKKNVQELSLKFYDQSYPCFSFKSMENNEVSLIAETQTYPSKVIQSEGELLENKNKLIRNIINYVNWENYSDSIIYPHDDTFYKRSYSLEFAFSNGETKKIIILAQPELNLTIGYLINLIFDAKEISSWKNKFKEYYLDDNYFKPNKSKE